MSIPNFYQYDENHDTKADELVVPEAPYVMTFDTKSMRISDYHHFTEALPLTIYKGVFINTLDQFVSQYADAVWQIATACEEIKKRGPAVGEKIVLDFQTGVNLIQRAQMRLDEALQRISTWDGSAPLNVILPYAEIAVHEFKAGDIVGQKPRLDTGNCKPMVNGMLFVAEWKDQADGLLRSEDLPKPLSTLTKQAG
jgi:hypothetical protein